VKAIEIYRGLCDAFPDNLDHGIHLARAQTKAEQGADALATIQALRRLPPPLGDDPRLELAELRAHEAIGDAKRMIEVADGATAKPRVQATRHVLAEILSYQGIALANLGKWDRGRTILDEARKILAETGDQRGVADAIFNAAALANWQGDFVVAVEKDQQALEIYKKIGDRSVLCTVLGNLANTQVTMGAIDEATKNLDETEPMRCVQSDVGSMRVDRGAVLEIRGDLAGAAAAYLGARDAFRNANDDHLVAWAEARLGALLTKQAKYGEARELLERSLEVREKGGFAQFAAESRLFLADLALAEKKFDLAEALARKAAASSAEQQLPCDRALAESVVAVALTAQGKHDDAHALFQPAEVVAAKCPSALTRLIIVIRGGADTIAPRDEVKKSLAAAREEASTRGYFELGLYAERALGALDLRGADRAAGKSRLARVARDAAAKGYARLAAELAER
jgi:tetratricopeptide (TPR) repeat protein